MNKEFIHETEKNIANNLTKYWNFLIQNQKEISEN